MPPIHGAPPRLRNGPVTKAPRRAPPPPRPAIARGVSIPLRSGPWVRIPPPAPGGGDRTDREDVGAARDVAVVGRQDAPGHGVRAGGRGRARPGSARDRRDRRRPRPGHPQAARIQHLERAGRGSTRSVNRITTSRGGASRRALGGGSIVAGTACAPARGAGRADPRRRAAVQAAPDGETGAEPTSAGRDRATLGRRRAAARHAAGLHGSLPSGDANVKRRRATRPRVVGTRNDVDGGEGLGRRGAPAGRGRGERGSGCVDGRSSRRTDAEAGVVSSAPIAAWLRSAVWSASQPAPLSGSRA